MGGQQEKEMDLESISWADGEPEGEHEEEVDLSRFGGQQEPAGDSFSEAADEGGEWDASREEDYPAGHEEVTEAPAPIYKKKWVLVSAIIGVVIMAFGIGIYKAMSRQAGQRSTLLEQVAQQEQKNTAPPVLPSINEENAAPPPADNGIVEASSSPAAQVQEGVASTMPQPQAHGPGEPGGAVAGGVNTQELKAYLDQQLNEIRASIAANERRHRGEYEKIALHIGKISKELRDQAQTARPRQVVAPAAAVAAPQVMAGYRLQSIVPGRAWIILPDESVKSVTVNDALPGGIRIERILAQEQHVITNRGLIR